MPDITAVRYNPSAFKADLKKRGLLEKIKTIDEILSLDKKHRELLGKAQVLREKRNQLSSEIEILKKNKKPIEGVLSTAKKIPSEIKDLEVQTTELKTKLDGLVLSLPNLLHDSVPLGKDDSANVVVQSFLEPKTPSFELKHHGELALSLGGADFERAVKISGSGFFFLKNELLLLDLALQRLAIDILLKKGFSPISVPFFLRQKLYSGVTDFSDFENVMYKIDGHDLFLIATSEHPIAAMLSDEILLDSELPIKYCGISACFRKEVGKHGLDERGFFRVHQFNKVEQFVFCSPKDSWAIHEELVKNSEEFLKQLGIPYQVVNVCTGDIGVVAAKKYDINGWSPREKKFIELMSISNCTTYQSERLGIKVRSGSGEKEYLHTLNGTMVATSRAIRLILENFQKQDGSVSIPKALQPYMGGIKEITPKKP